MSNSFNHLIQAEKIVSNLALLPHLVQPSPNPAIQYLRGAGRFIDSSPSESFGHSQNSSTALRFSVADRKPLRRMNRAAANARKMDHHPGRFKTKE